MGLAELNWAYRIAQAGAEEVAPRLVAIVYAQVALEKTLEQAGFPKDRFAGRRDSAVVAAGRAACKRLGIGFPARDLVALIQVRNSIGHDRDVHDAEWLGDPSQVPSARKAQFLVSVARDLVEALSVRQSLISTSEVVGQNSGYVLAPPIASVALLHHTNIRIDGIYVCRYEKDSAACIRFRDDFVCQMIRCKDFEGRYARTVFRLGEASGSVTVRPGYLNFADSTLIVQGHHFQVRIPVPGVIHMAGVFPGPRGPVDLSGDYIFDQDDPSVDPRQPKPIIDVTDRQIPLVTKQILASRPYLRWRDWIIQAYTEIRSGNPAKRGELVHMRREIDSMKRGEASEPGEVQAGLHLERLMEALESGMDQTRPSYFHAYFVTGSYDDWL